VGFGKLYCFWEQEFGFGFEKGLKEFGANPQYYLIRQPYVFVTNYLGGEYNRCTMLLNSARIWRGHLAIALSLAIPFASLAADNSYKVMYDGGSIEGTKAGTSMKLYLDSLKVRVVKDKSDVVSIPASAITEISYGQDVHRRVGAAIGLAVVSLGVGALMALSKSKKHYVGITWDDNGKKGGIAFQADKNDYRGLLAGLEGISGKKAVNSETMGVKN